MPTPNMPHASEGWHPGKLMQYYRLDASLRWHDMLTSLASHVGFAGMTCWFHWHDVATLA